MNSTMLQEIAQQPEALARTLKEERSKAQRLGKFLRQRDIDLIILAARGSSDNAAQFGRYLLELTTGLPVSFAAPSIYTLYNKIPNSKRALVIGVSQSGAGEDVNTVLEESKKKGAYTLAITNEPRSRMAQIADEALLMHGGKELSVAATKTYSAELLHFYLLAEALSDVKLESCDVIPEFAAEALNTRPRVEEIVQRYVFMENCVVIGRGLMYGNTFEWALKLMETCYVVAERFSSADFFHGPLAVIERHFPVLALAPPGVTLPGVKQLLQRLHELHADTFVITGDAELGRSCTRAIQMPAVISEYLAPIPYMIPAQLFAALLSLAKGLNADAPRSLSKVTVTR